MPKISIVVPVYNVSAYLPQTLDSLVGQTLEDIEIIAVDDGSTDESREILEAYEARDARVRPVYLPENRGTSLARKAGVASATGDYITFVDADDSLAPKACETAYELIQKEKVDILHFGTSIISCNTHAQIHREDTIKFIAPYEKRLRDKDLISYCFVRENFGHSLWAKLYPRALCQRAFADIEDKRITIAEDLYASFILLYYAKSYAGVNTGGLYNYYYGRGVTGERKLNLPAFEKLLTSASSVQAIERFLTEKQAIDRYRDAYGIISNNLIGDCAYAWRSRLEAKDSDKGFDAFVRAWGKVPAISSLADAYWNEPWDIAQKARGAEALQRKERKAKVIGAYYHRIHNGGAERLVVSLIQIWQQMGYEVVLFTDETPNANEYPVSEKVKRVVLPHFWQHEEKHYHGRAKALQAALHEHQVDLMVYFAWVSRTGLWDMLITKTEGIPFMFHTLSVFSAPVMNADHYFSSMPYVYALCDAVATLSRTDVAYWQRVNPNSLYMSPPLTFSVEGIAPAALDSPHILWLARISHEKRPEDVLEIMREVVAAVPSAVLDMVGSGDTEKYAKRLKRKIRALGLEKNIIMHGFQADITPFYENASVFLMTSKYEGFSTTVMESKVYGIPLVSYDMPYQEPFANGRGMRRVPQKDKKAAAGEIIALLSDEQARRALGAEARESVAMFANVDFAAQWQEVISAMETPAPKTTPRDDAFCPEQVMWDTLLFHYRTSAEELLSTMHTRGYKIGKVITALSRGTKDGIKKAWWRLPMSVRRPIKKALRRS